MRADVFARSYNRRSLGRVRCVQVEVPAGAELGAILAEAVRAELG